MKFSIKVAYNGIVKVESAINFIEFFDEKCR